MNNTFQKYKATTEPKFFLAYTTSDTLTYSYLELNMEVQTGQNFLYVYDTEEELSTAIDSIKGIPGWYMQDANRIPHPPNPNPWEPEPEPIPDPLSGDTI